MKFFDPDKHPLRHHHQKDIDRSTLPSWDGDSSTLKMLGNNRSNWVLHQPKTGSRWTTTVGSLMENTLLDTTLPQNPEVKESIPGGNTSSSNDPASAFMYAKTMTIFNQSHEMHETREDYSYQSFMYSIVIPIMLLCCFASALINLAVVLSARWCRKPMSPTLYFSFSLALADAFASTVLGTGLVVNSLLPSVYSIRLSNCFSLALEAFRLGGVLVTVAHLLALSINYWIGIVRPLQYAATMTRKTAIRVICVSWCWPISGLLLYFSTAKDQGFRSPQCEDNSFLLQQTFRTIVALFFFAPLIFMTVIYSHIFIIVRNHQRYSQRYQSSVQLRRNVKAVVTTCLILGTYIIGWMPAILWYLLVCDDCLFQIGNIPAQVKIPVNITINFLIILKAVVDPIIFALRMTDIQMALSKMRYNFFLWVFESCASPWSPPKTSMEAGSVCFTKSIRLSSRRSSSRSNV